MVHNNDNIHTILRRQNHKRSTMEREPLPLQRLSNVLHAGKDLFAQIQRNLCLTMESLKRFVVIPNN